MSLWRGCDVVAGLGLKSESSPSPKQPESDIKSNVHRRGNGHDSSPSSDSITRLTDLMPRMKNCLHFPIFTHIHIHTHTYTHTHTKR